MVQLHTCSCGYRWESTAEMVGGETHLAVNCPMCGAASQTSATSKTSLPESVLPPAPRRPRESIVSAGTVDSGDPRSIQDSFYPAVAGYEVLGELGRGGMGVVFKAKQLSLKRIVALKMLLAGSFPGSRALARFHTEAEAIARLQHPNIVHIYDIGDQDGCPYIAMEFVDGGSLRDRLRDALPAPRQAAEWILPLVRAIQHAHTRGIVHRDLKPANVLLTADGTLKVTDFGLAKQLDDQAGQTESGAILGTPSYMAPEQAQGRVKEIAPATDVYALGAILYEMLTGARPFDGETTLDVLMKVVSEEAVRPSRLRPDVPADLEAICLKCLAKAPEQRYASAALLGDDLDRFLAGTRILAGRTVSPAEPVKAQPRWTAARLGILATALAAVLLVLGGWWMRQHLGSSGGPAPETTRGAAGPEWETLRVGTAEERFTHIAFPTRQIGYAASQSALYRTNDGGKTWKRLGVGKVGSLGFLHFSTRRKGWIGGDEMRTTEDGGDNWSAVPLPGSEPPGLVTALGVGADGWLLAAATMPGGDLVLFQRPTTGSAWTRLDGVETNYWGGVGAPYRKWAAGHIAMQDARQAVLLLCRDDAEGGVLLATADAGRSWTRMLASESDLYQARFLDARRGWLTGSRGALWSTQDGGATWQAQANPSGVSAGCLAFDQAGGAFGIAPLWNGKVLQTTTGENWQEIDVKLGYSLPDAVVVDPGCAYVLGSEGRIARYLDPRIPAPAE
jgi:hypothetical protein